MTTLQIYSLLSLISIVVAVGTILYIIVNYDDIDRDRDRQIITE